MPVEPPRLRKRKRKDKQENPEPSKVETEVGKHLRWNCPNKTSTMMSHKVEYFIGSKAVDCLLDSKWASGKGGTEILFTNRSSVEAYLDRLLTLGFFNRVSRIKKRKKEDEKEKDKDKSKEDSEGKKAKKKKEKKEEEVEFKPEENKTKVTEATADAEGKKKRKVKVKLEMHEEQIFMDGDEAYVWIFDPIHPKTFIMGILVVVATIAICLFPLWPYNVREYVWYVSVILAAGVGMILVLAVLRYVFFAVIWAVTMGRHHFWLLPNLTEECGFFESFKPLYTYEYRPPSCTEEQKENEKQKENEEEKENENGEAKDENGEEKDENEEGKEIDGEKDSWVKLTEEEVETARNQAEVEC